MGCGRNGFREYCQIPASRLDRGVVNGTATAPVPANRRARGAGRGENSTRIYRFKEPLSVTPQAVEEAFIEANPGLSASGRLRCQAFD
jgi:hypothetical protein